MEDDFVVKPLVAQDNTLMSYRDYIEECERLVAKALSLSSYIFERESNAFGSFI